MMGFRIYHVHFSAIEFAWRPNFYRDLRPVDLHLRDLDVVDNGEIIVCCVEMMIGMVNLHRVG